jgi:hypothetical protein
VRLTGDKKQFTFSYKTDNLVRRLLAAKPDPSSYAPIGLALSFPQIDDRENGNGNGKLEAGEQGSITLTVANSGAGDGYLVCAEPLSGSGDILLSKSDETALLRSGRSATVSVPFSIPLKAPDGEATVQFVAKDAQGRQSPPLSVRLPYSHRDLPELQISSVRVISYDPQTGSAELEVNVRNRGAGVAERVQLTAQIKSINRRADAIAVDIQPFSRQPVRIKFQSLGKEASSGPVNVSFNVTERLGVANISRDAALLLSEPGQETLNQ